MLFQDHIDYIKSQSLQEQQAYSLYIDNCKSLEAILQNNQANKRLYKKVTDGCRDMMLCFTDGQRIRSKRAKTEDWIGIFQKASGTISCKGITYNSLGQFALAYCKTVTPDRTTVYGWAECECEIDGKWVSTFKLPAL